MDYDEERQPYGDASGRYCKGLSNLLSIGAPTIFTQDIQYVPGLFGSSDEVQFTTAAQRLSSKISSRPRELTEAKPNVGSRRADYQTFAVKNEEF